MAMSYNRDEEIRGALREHERKSAVYEWMKQRSQAVKQNVSAHDVLRHFGTSLKFGGSAHEEQFSCPFHGKDRKPSARVYPDGPRSSSHVWCFTCQKNWDVFGLWREFAGHGEEVRFSQIIFELEKAFGVIPPEAPEMVNPQDTGPTEQEKDIDRLFEVCENMLREAKPEYDGKTNFLLAGQLLDRLRYRHENRAIDLSELEKVLRTFIDRVAVRIKSRAVSTVELP
jgi:hypothetical protein